MKQKQKLSLKEMVASFGKTRHVRKRLTLINGLKHATCCKFYRNNALSSKEALITCKIFSVKLNIIMPTENPCRELKGSQNTRRQYFCLSGK